MHIVERPAESAAVRRVKSEGFLTFILNNEKWLCNKMHKQLRRQVSAFYFMSVPQFCVHPPESEITSVHVQ